VGLDQPILRNDLVCTKKQHGEEGTLLRAAELERLPIGDRLQRAKDSELHSPPDPFVFATLAPSTPRIYRAGLKREVDKENHHPDDRD
jgi:hypothetical protein